MANVDPTGFQATLAAIPKGQLSERQERIAAGVAMIQGGSTLNAASKACGIPLSTLWGYARGITKFENENEGRRGRDIEALHDACVDNALLASEKLRTALTHDDWTHGDLVKALGVNVDKIAVLSQRTAAPATGMSELVSALLDQAEISLKKRDPLE